MIINIVIKNNRVNNPKLVFLTLVQISIFWANNAILIQSEKNKKRHLENYGPWSSQNHKSSAGGQGFHQATCSPTSNPGGKFAEKQEIRICRNVPCFHRLINLPCNESSLRRR